MEPHEALRDLKRGSEGCHGVLRDFEGPEEYQGLLRDLSGY